MPIAKLKPYPGNARKGSIPTIVESLKAHGQYRPLVVQRSTGFVLVGNHTMLGLKEIGEDSALVNYLDVDDDQARRIVIVDNRANDLAGYDQALLSDLLASLPDPVGTGFSSDELDEIMALSQQATKEAIATLDTFLRPPAVDFTKRLDITAPPPAKLDDGLPPPVLDDRGRPALDKKGDPIEYDDIENADSLLNGGLVSLVNDMTFDSNHPFGIPPLRPDMMVTGIPEPALDTWASSATRRLWEEDPTRWDKDGFWLYAVGADSTTGLIDRSKVIPHFYTYDDNYEHVWGDPASYTGRLLNTKVSAICTPDFSYHDTDPLVVSIWNLYRNAWLGRYFQEAGIRVIPNMTWLGGKEHEDKIVPYFLWPFPVGSPVVICQLQTASFTDGVGIAQRKADPELWKQAKREFEIAIEYLQPEVLLAYGSKNGHDSIKRMRLKTNVVPVNSRSVYMNEDMNKRMEAKKKGKLDTRYVEDDGNESSNDE